VLLTVSGGLSRVVAKPEAICVSIDGLKADIANRGSSHMRSRSMYPCTQYNTHESDLRYGLVFGEVRAGAEETVEHRACHVT